MAQARGLSFHDSTRLLLINTVASFKESRRWGKDMTEGNFAKNLFSEHRCVFGEGVLVVGDGIEIGKSVQIDV